MAALRLATHQLECSPLVLVATTVQRKVLPQLQRSVLMATMIAAPIQVQL
jgi:hypothetical protein